jgi:hypothetical protein
MESSDLVSEQQPPLNDSLDENEILGELSEPPLSEHDLPPEQVVG